MCYISLIQHMQQSKEVVKYGNRSKYSRTKYPNRNIQWSKYPNKVNCNVPTYFRKKIHLDILSLDISVWIFCPRFVKYIPYSTIVACSNDMPTFVCNGWQRFLIFKLLSVVGFLSFFGQLPTTRKVHAHPYLHNNSFMQYFINGLLDRSRSTTSRTLRRSGGSYCEQTNTSIQVVDYSKFRNDNITRYCQKTNYVYWRIVIAHLPLFFLIEYT
ncbi:hypothetical protein AGLY_017186 [Aphis glycines]|uniref:Uncharacterized protein n=1 Tax=Aphis glycines TaxID=307491 RepID=A0A6G0SXP2_APHGL|nr:hypothetical protein AGLY_017186 [Aphis glycines]